MWENFTGMFVILCIILNSIGIENTFSNQEIEIFKNSNIFKTNSKDRPFNTRYSNICSDSMENVFKYTRIFFE